MVRYQIVYSKTDFPLAFWSDSEEDARIKSANLRKYGYSVQVWLHTTEGASMTNL